MIGRTFLVAFLKNSLLDWISSFLFSPFSIVNSFFCVLGSKELRYSMANRAEPPKLILISGCWVWTPINIQNNGYGKAPLFMLSIRYTNIKQ